MPFAGTRAQPVSAVHDESKAQGRRGNRLFSMLLRWFGGDRKDKDDTFRIGQVLEACLQEKDQDLLEVCGDELGWLMREKNPFPSLFPHAYMPCPITSSLDAANKR